VALVQTLEASLDESERNEKTVRVMLVQLQLQSDVQKEENRRQAELVEAMRGRMEEMRAIFEAERTKGSQLLEKNRAMERELTEARMRKSKLLCF